MAYYLKKTKLKGRTYLSIDESFYDPIKKGTAHKVYQSLSSIETLKASGIEDPIAYYQQEVDKLNQEIKKKELKLISEESPIRYLGYFPLKAMMNKLNVKATIDLFKFSTNFDFDLYEVLCGLVYGRVVKPCSKHQTFYQVIPYLFEENDYSYNQLLAGLRFYGNDYEKFVELFTTQTKRKFKLNTDITYFDCTNFYFEIDREDNFRKKGPSKENRVGCPLVSLGLLLDSNQIPIGMKVFAGNESEKPKLREVIDNLKSQNNITGRTIHVADKGLNSAKNIFEAKKSGDGYLFSKSVKQLPETEITWLLLANDYKEVKDNDGNILYRYKSCIEKFPYKYSDDEGNIHTFKLSEKRLATYNPSLAKKKNWEIDRMIEKAHLLAASKALKDEYGECSKYLNFKSIDGSKVSVTLNQEKIDKDRKLAGYNLLVTSETKMKDIDIYTTYHNLWRIEESFRIMKSDLDARPVYVQTEEAIKGHFFICYVAVLLERLLQFVILDNKYCSNDLFNFFKNFQLIKTKYGYTNITAANNFIRELANFTSLPIMHLNLTENQVNKILSYKI